MTAVKLKSPGSDPSYFEGTHITFDMIGESPSGKTVLWLVLAKRGSDHLGEIKWFARWRKYSFFPAPGCVFEQVCLREIAQFIEDRSREHRTGI